MSKFQEALDKYEAKMTELGISFDSDLLKAVTKGCGPAIYNRDASTVSCSDSSEMARVKNNFLIKKLGLADSPALDEALTEACEKMGKSNPMKYRAIFYYLLVVKFGKQSVYA